MEIKKIVCIVQRVHITGTVTINLFDVVCIFDTCSCANIVFSSKGIIQDNIRVVVVSNEKSLIIVKSHIVLCKMYRYTNAFRLKKETGRGASIFTRRRKLTFLAFKIIVD